jgi:Tfp pilus assembly protein PilN
MITINLRPGQKRKAAGASPLGGVQEGLKRFGASVRNPALAGAAAVLAVVVAGLAWLFVSTGSELAALEPQLEAARAEQRRYASVLADKRKQEALRDSLASQIGIIRGVDGDRYVWSHVLDEVARALPEFTWLTDIASVPPAPVDSSATDSVVKPRPAFVVQGRTVDIQAYTKFLRDLEASPWISDVTPLQANTVVEENRAVTAFSVRASFTSADSAYMRTVPLSQSVR